MLLPLAAFVLFLAAPMAAPAEAPFTFDKAPGRLPKDVVPLHYRIAIVPQVKEKAFTGTESVTLRSRSPTATVVFNTLNLTLRNVRVDGKPVQRVVSDNQGQLTTLTLAAPMSVGVHTLTLSYNGVIGSGPQGLFAQPYTQPDGSSGLVLSTKMESTDARRMFPCWDEPAFRATFQLTATVPAEWATVSNMPVAKRVVQGKLATTTFERSPRMPSYLVEFSAGDLQEVAADHDGVHFGVWAVRGRESDGATALANAQQILTDYNNYFGYPYPLPKLDSIAVPGGFSGAMENWGAITYNDQLLLVGSRSSIADRQAVFSVQAHEMAHQWNGDLVTMGWWDDLWLNESFASWRAAKETDLRNPSWKWWEKQDADKESAMRADARTSSQAIQRHVTDEVQASSAFDPEITYRKGQAVLRMFEAYLGPDTFRDGIRGYMKARAFGNATTADLWNALSKASGQDVGAIASGWTEQPGFPLVSVTASCDAAGKRTLSLSQRRFLLQKSDSSRYDPATSRWKIPLQIRSGLAGVPRNVLLTREAQSERAGTCQEPLTVNAGAVGFYRVQYDAATLVTLSSTFGSLPDGDRIALLDDQWALVESGAAPLASYLMLAASMGTDLDSRAWEQITEALGTVEYDERGSAGHDAFAAYGRSILKPVAEQLGWDARPGETPAIQQLRRTLIGDLGSWDDQEVIAEAHRRFTSFLSNRGAIDPNDQLMTLAIVAQHADATTFEQLHALAKQARDDAEQTRFYAALASVRDSELAGQAAKIALSSELPAQAVQLRFRMIGTLQNAHPALAWSIFSANAEMLLAPFGHNAPLFLAQYSPNFFWNSLPLDQLEGWLKAHVPAEMSPNVVKGMESARFKASEKAFLVPAADAYIASKKNPRNGQS